MSVRERAAAATADSPTVEPSPCPGTVAERWRAARRIAVVAISYIARRDGISVYTESLLVEFLAAARDAGRALTIDVFACGDAAGILEERLIARLGEDPGTPVAVNVVATPGDGLWTKYLEIPRRVRRGRYDAVVLPNLQPVWLPADRTLAILHDLTYRVAAPHFPFWRRVYMDLLTRFWLMRTRTVGCISESGEADLLRYYPASARRRRLQLPNGLPEKIAAQPRPSTGETERALTDNVIDLLFVGRLNRLKGFDRICRLCEWLEAYCAEQGLTARIHVVGKDTAESAELLGSLRSNHVSLERHGYLDDDALNALYRRSGFCLFFSRNEGFGLPVLEGIWQGCVPLLSDIGVFHEVMGEGYPLFADDERGHSATIAFIHRVRTDAAYRGEILARMEDALSRWEQGYARAARRLLEWAQQPAAKKGEVT